MKSLLFSSLFILITIATSAQNWQTINSKTQSLFLNDNPTDYRILGLMADSVKATGGDSIYYLYRTTNKFCYFNISSIWAGDSVIIKPNGENIFYIPYKPRVTIQTKAQINDSWQLLQLSNGDHIEATVTSIGASNVLNIPDSIKTIQLQAYDASNQPVNHDLNNYEIIISKNYGFVQVFNFSTAAPYFFLTLYRLRPPTVQEIYDFEIGDEIQIKTVAYYGGTIPYHGGYITYTISDKKYAGDSIIYTWLSGDTLVAKNLNDLFVPLMPQEGYYTEIGLPSAQYSLNEVEYDTTCGGRLQVNISSDYMYAKHPDSCFFSNVSYLGQVNGYAEGLGKTYFFTQYDPSNSSIKYITESLQFYKKGSDSCGSRITTSINDPEVASLKLYPNPASEFISISLPENHDQVTLEIFNLNGSLIMKKNITNSQQININELQPGFYLYKIMLLDKVIGGKLVVQR